MNKQSKWQLICRYISIKKEASIKKIKFYNTKQRFINSCNFAELLDSMENVLNGTDDNFSLFDNERRKIRVSSIPLPENIDEIILFDEYKNLPFLENIEPWKVPFLFIRGKVDNCKEIFEKTQTDVISIVGSRKTPEIYGKWIQERMPIDKIVVSGLANGADLIGHREAIKKHMKIVVFPGYDISKNPSKHKMDVWEYALSEGLIISSVVPGIETYIQADLINRNYEMAKVVSVAYALCFDDKSGTLNHLKVVAEDGKKIIVPYNIYRDVIPNIDNKVISNQIVTK